MRLRISLLALACVLFATDAAQAQRGGYGRGGYGGGGYGRGGYGYGGYGGYGRGGYGYGSGISIGVGSGFSIGVGSGYYGSPYYGRGYYPGYYGSNNYYDGGRYYTYPNAIYTPSTTYVAPVYSTPSTTYVEPASANAPSGLQITDVYDGGAAKKGNLRPGDIITAVGSIRTQTFEELQRALAAMNSETEVAFINGNTNKAEKTRLTPDNGKIGVAVVPVYLP